MTASGDLTDRNYLFSFDSVQNHNELAFSTTHFLKADKRIAFCVFTMMSFTLHNSKLFDFVQMQMKKLSIY